jgi:mRNA-degrading endonuclease toxin of MazEF toxin-antitoxin module
MKRGEIYYIERRNCFSTIGEAPKARPGVIVSADSLNANSTVVMVVYLTTHPQQSLPTHVCVHATGTPSTVLCERIDYVPIEMLGNYAGTCTEKEMAAIERGMLKALDMEWRADPSQTKAEPLTASTELKCISDTVNHPSHYTDGTIEVIDYIEDKKLGYHLGNAVKYISRAGKKDPTKKVEDLRKAAWYINREIKRLTKEEIA